MNSKAGSEKATQLLLAVSLRTLPLEPSPHVVRRLGPQCEPGCSSGGVWAPAKVPTDGGRQQPHMLVNKLSNDSSHQRPAAPTEGEGNRDRHTFPKSSTFCPLVRIYK